MSNATCLQVAVTNAEARHGVLMLTADNLTILGGQVSAMVLFVCLGCLRFKALFYTLGIYDGLHANSVHVSTLHDGGTRTPTMSDHVYPAYDMSDCGVRMRALLSQLRCIGCLSAKSAVMQAVHVAFVHSHAPSLACWHPATQ